VVWTRWAVAVFLVPAFGACGESETLPDAAAEARSFPLYAAFCRFLERCKPDFLAQFHADSVEECVKYTACSAEWEHSLLDRLDDPQGCLEFVENADCSAMDAVFSGGLSSFQIGAITFQTGSTCTFKPPDLGPRLAEGSPCLTLNRDEESCDAGLFCAVTTPARVIGYGHCGVCAAAAAAGEYCSDELRCLPDHRCLSGICERMREGGEACELDRQCRWPPYCIDGFCQTAEALEPSPLPDAAELLGGSCDPNDSDDACNQHIAVTCVDGLCTKRPDLGEPCDPERSQCRAGQVCDGGECVEVGCSLDIGEPCPGGLCSNGLTCDPESLRCIEGPGLGEPCDYGCRDPYVCDHVSDTCIELLPNGSPCRSSAGCASAYCDRDYSADCEPNSCVISICEEDCGVCSDYPSAVGCND
jgi:hypothetical protein